MKNLISKIEKRITNLESAIRVTESEQREYWGKFGKGNDALYERISGYNREISFLKDILKQTQPSPYLIDNPELTDGPGFHNTPAGFVCHSETS